MRRKQGFGFIKLIKWKCLAKRIVKKLYSVTVFILLLIMCITSFAILPPAISSADSGTYNLISADARGGEGRSYEEWTKYWKETLPTLVGYPPSGYDWSVGVGSCYITTSHYSWPDNTVINQTSYQDTYEIPESMPAGGKVTIPISMSATITNWPADKSYGFCGGITFYIYVSNDKAEWTYLVQKGFSMDGVNSLNDVYEMNVPSQYKYLLISTEHSNGTIGGLGMNYVYELIPQTPTPTQTPAHETNTPAPTSVPVPTSTPPVKRTLNLMGEVRDINLDLMPFVTMVVKSSLIGEQTIHTDKEGFYAWDIELPDDAETISLSVTLRLCCERENKEVFNIVDTIQSAYVEATSEFTVDLRDPAYIGLAQIVVPKDFNFGSVPMGYMSENNKGEPDALIANVGIYRLPGFSYVYHQMWAGLVTAEDIFKEKDAMQNTFPLFIFVDNNKPSSSGSLSYFSQSGGSPIICLGPADSTYSDTARFCTLHEFGHYFEWATNNKKSRCKWDEAIDSGDKNHGGYLNSSTSDSVIEGFATWYVSQVQKYGPYKTPKTADDMAEFGTLSDNRKAFLPPRTSEEDAISHVMYLISEEMSLKDFWTVFKKDEDNLFSYYQSLRKSEWGKRNKKKLESIFYDAGLYKMPFGNQVFDPWEPYQDLNKNAKYDKTTEKYADLMFKDDLYEKPVREMKPGEKIIIGQSSDASRNRNSLLHLENSWLDLTGELPVAMHMVIRQTGLAPRSYVAPVVDGRIYVSLPAEPSDGIVEAKVPGGEAVWSGDISELQTKFKTTIGRDTPLDTVSLKAEDHPIGLVVVRPVEGSAEKQPYRDPNQLRPKTDDSELNYEDTDITDDGDTDEDMDKEAYNNQDDGKKNFWFQQYKFAIGGLLTGILIILIIIAKKRKR